MGPHVPLSQPKVKPRLRTGRPPGRIPRHQWTAPALKVG